MKTVLFLTLTLFVVSAHAQWTTNGTNIYNSNTGNVGVGTSSPGSKLDVQTTLPSQGTYSSQLWSTSNANYFLRLQTVWSTTGINQQFVQRFNGADYSILSFYGGNVGIGTTSPAARLQVMGGDLIQYGSIPNNNSAQFYNTSATGFGLYAQGGGGGRYVFNFVNQEGTSIMYGRGDGNVGIGTGTPDAKLAVKGSIHAQEIRIDLSVPAPDYVFEPTYKLSSLEEIKAYIEKNKHLPEVPSAKEMEAHGVNLGEMNMLLLKKIEELTLHMINQQKEIQDLKTKILTSK